MAIRKTLNEQIEAAQAEIIQKENRLKELRAKQKEQERKNRNHRLCKRMGLFEKLIPDTIELTDEQFQTFLEKAVANDYGKRTLANITAQSNLAPTAKSARPTPQGANNQPQKPSESPSSQSTTTSEKTTTPTQNGGAGASPTGGSTTRQGS